MAVVRRGKTWQAQVRTGRDPVTGKWRTKSVTCDTKEQARKAEAAIIAKDQEDRRRFVDPSSTPLGVFLDGYIAQEEPRLRVNTVAQYKHMVDGYIRPAIGNVKLADLSPTTVQRFLTGLGARRQTEQIRTFLRVALADAERLGMVTVNAAARAKAPYRKAPKRTSYTLEEAQAIIAAAEGAQCVNIFALAVYSGLRRGELLGLRWEDVTWGQNPSLSVRRQVISVANETIVQDAPKTAAGRRDVPLIPQAVEVLQRQRNRRGATAIAGYVFPKADGGPLDPGNVSKSFLYFARKAGGPTYPLHALRHTTASLLLSAGVPPEQAAKLLGHKSLAVFFTIYADLLAPAMTDAGQKLAAYVAAQGAR